VAQRAIRFSETTDKRIREATERRGFSSPTALIRYAVEQDLSGQKEKLVTAEERLVASIEQVQGSFWCWGDITRPCLRW
jgi:Arc/MetJ-type ribon-helix-helix transcriptional regulator